MCDATERLEQRKLECDLMAGNYSYKMNHFRSYSAGI